MAGPLTGIKVLDLGMWVAGPYCGKLLADLGADVIKLEPPGGEQSRSSGSAGFPGLNRGKRGIVVDLQKPEGQEVALRLAAQSDAVVENFRTGVNQRLKVDYQTLSAVNPRLIYATVRAFGSAGPYAFRPGVDPLLQSYSGISLAQGGGGNPPVFLRVAVCDIATAMLALVGITTALFARSRTGRGQYLETSLLNSGIFLQSGDFLDYEGKAGRVLSGEGQYGLSPLHSLYETADGWLFISCEDDAAWQALCRALDRPALGEDPRFGGTPWLKDGQPRNPLGQTLAGIFAERSTNAWLAALSAHGVPCAPVHEFRDNLLNPDLVARNLLVEHQHPELGRLTQTQVLTEFSEDRGQAVRPSPTLGQHTDEVFSDFGFSAEEVAGLRARRVIG